MAGLFESILTEDQFAAVLAQIADGKSVVKACSAVGVARAMFYRTLDAADCAEGWPMDGASRRDRYTRATQAGLRSMADDIADLSDKAIGAESNVQVQGYRLAVDTRRWLLSKMAPKQYGDRVDVDVGGQVTIQLSKDDAAL
jgi:hypothetical protein